MASTFEIKEPLQLVEGVLATDELMPKILMHLESADDIAIDTETSGLNVRNNIDYLMGFCFDVPGLACYVPFRHREANVEMRWVQFIEQILQRKDLIWHHQKFDWHSVKTIGIDPLKFKGRQYDTQLIASLVNENLYDKSLNTIVRTYLGKEYGKYDSEVIHELGKKIGFHMIPAEMYRQYGSHDAHLTRRVLGPLWKQMEQQELTSVYWSTESPFVSLLYSLEQRGVGLNTDLCESYSYTGNSRMATISRQLDGRNPASPLDLKHLLLSELELPVLKHTKSCEQCTKYKKPVDSHDGPPSFDKSVMEDYDAILEGSNNPTARLIAEYRGWQKAVTALYEPALEKQGPDGLIRTEFQQHRTVTGRLSSSNPNLQQIPRNTSKPWNGKAKHAFPSGRGSDYAHFGWDWSQIELRLSAAYAGETILLAEFAKPDADPFKVLAPLIFGEYSDEYRHLTKNKFVYPSLYGAQLPRIALELGMSKEQARPLYENYLAGIPHITKLSEQVNQLAYNRKYIKYWDGRRRHFPFKDEARKAWNSLLQGGAAQVMKATMLNLQQYETEDAFMVLTVHDEISWVIRRDLLPEYDKIVTHEMTKWDFGVKLAVEGKEWAKAA